MSAPIVQPPRCHSCQAVLTPPGQVCGVCRANQVVAPMVRVPVGQPKSAGVAVLLSFLWFGAGHLYAGRVGAGVALAIYDFVLLMIAVTGLGLIVAVPLWLLSAPVVMITAASAANKAGGGYITVPQVR